MLPPALLQLAAAHRLRNRLALLRLHPDRLAGMAPKERVMREEYLKVLTGLKAEVDAAA